MVIHYEEALYQVYISITNSNAAAEGRHQDFSLGAKNEWPKAKSGVGVFGRGGSNPTPNS